MSSDHLHSDTGEREKFEVHQAEFSQGTAVLLPEEYGDDRLVAMVRDPRCMFAYWEFTPANAERLRREGGGDIWENSDFILRVYDDFGSFFDVGVAREARQTYIHLGRDGGAYVVDLGLRRRDGVFFSLLRSNRVQLPAGHVSHEVDSQFARLHVSTVENGAGPEALLQGFEHIGRGSAEFSKSMAQRWEFLKAVFSGSPWGAVSSHSIPSSSASGNKP